MKIKETIKKQAFPILLLLLVGLIFAANYHPGTYLIGWDSLQTEQNPLLAIKRATHASWEEYQSFGLTSGMAHAADLVRSVFVLFMSIVIPASMVRFVFHMLMVYVGGLGFFVLLKYLGFDGKKRVLAFIGACFYILNLGAIQIFSLPFEPFSIFFAMLPWEIYIFLKFAYAQKITPKHIISLVFVNILASPQAYLQTIFVVYFICLFFLSFGVLFESTNKKKLIRRFIVSYGLIILVNLFWILPQIYFLRTSLSVVTDSKINQLATDIVTHQNFEKGTIKNFARLEGFYFDLHDTGGRLIFAPWHNHFNNFFIQVLSYLPFVLVLLGIFKKHRSHFGFVSIFILVSLMLLSNTEALSYFNSLIFNNTFINQIFRSPFTKFVVPFSLVYSYLFVAGLEIVYQRVIEAHGEENEAHVLERIVFTAVAILLIITYSLPAFLGHYFADLVKVKVPDAYFKTADYFSQQDKNKRIGLLPEYTFWGWYSTKWGYDGSGFIWYWVEQPIVSRTFDVWSLKSESYFWELKYAIESSDVNRFENVLEKYDIDYLILDRSLKPVASVEEGMQYDQLAKILSQTNKVYLDQNFGEVEIYKVNHEKKIDNFVSVADTLPSAGPKIKLTNFDQAYQDLGDYKTVKSPDYIYPFLDLTTQTDIENKRWNISEDDNYFIFTARLSNYDLSNYHLEEIDNPEPAKVFLGEEIKSYPYEVEKNLDGNLLTVKIKKDKIESFDPTYVEVNNCRDLGEFGVVKRGATLAIQSEDRGMACFGYSSALLDHWNGYLVKVNSENVKGKELFFYIFGNRTRKQSKLETNLKGGTEYFILNPGYYFDDGYFFSFQNPSYESLESENKLNLLEIYLLPFNYLKKLRLVRNDLPGSLTKAHFSSMVDSQKDNYYTYHYYGRLEGGEQMILYQSFDPGWRIYKINQNDILQSNLPYFYGEKVLNHYEVNNWANGWEVPTTQEGESLLIFFWPQLLEYAGIIALIVIWNLAVLGAFLRVKSWEKLGKNL